MMKKTKWLQVSEENRPTFLKAVGAMRSLLFSLLAQSLVSDRKNNTVIRRAIRFEVVMVVREGTALFWVVRP
jgi:hypothetical protein